MSTVSTLIAAGTKELIHTSPSSRLDATLLFCFVSGFSKTEVFSKSESVVAEPLEKRFRELIARRKKFEPVAYITGEKEFYGLRFKVTPAVLIPRPETEILVEKALEDIEKRGARHEKMPYQILDLGTGSGCISVTLSFELKKRGISHQILAVDKSEEALKIARENAAQHGVKKEIQFLQSDWFKNIAPEKKFHVIAANPPYIAVGDTRVSKELKFEPHGPDFSALYSGKDGLDDIRIVFREASQRLNSGGLLACEIGDEQGFEVKKIALDAGFPESKISLLRDYGGGERLVLAEIT